MKKISSLILLLICILSNLLRKILRNFRNFIEEMLISDASSSSSSESSDENINHDQNLARIIKNRYYRKTKKWAKDDDMDLYKFKPYKMVQLKYDKNLKYPTARSGHRIICTESNIYLLGGFNPEIATIARPAAACLFTEFWKYNIATRKWELLVDRKTKNMPRELASNAIVMYRNAVIAHGGTGFPFGEANSNNTHIFGTQKSLVRKLECSGDFPWPQYGPSLVIHDDNLYTIGGTTGYDYFCDIYRLDLKTNEWASIYISRPELREDPEGRYRHETIYTGKHILVLGGGTSHINYDLKKLPAFNLEKNVWEYIDTKPDPSLPQRMGYPKSRKCFSCIQYEVKDVNDNSAIEAIIAGGLGNNNIHLSDIWKFRVSTMTWVSIKDDKLNKPTYFHSAATAGNGAMYIFGGIEVRCRDSLERTNDMYKMWTTIPKLSEMCWDAITHYDSYLDRYSTDQLLKFGIPLEFANRVEHSSSSTKDKNRMKYGRLFESQSVLFQSPTKRFRSLSQ